MDRASVDGIPAERSDMIHRLLKHYRFTGILASLIAAMTLTACLSTSRPPIATADYVDLQRFMGDWYVIASIPTSLEENAYNAVESYELEGDNRVKTTFTFREGGFDGDKKEYHPVGFVRDPETNAVWGMRFIWPFKADYRILYVDADYTLTVIGRQKRDYVWIMARTPEIDTGDYERLAALVAERGYDVTELRRVPQRWN